MSRVTLPTTRFTVADYERMAEADVFGDRRVELINGRIYRMPPQKGPHMTAITKTMYAFDRVRLATDWILVQGTLRLDAHSAPDPDVLWLPVPIGTPEHLWLPPIVLVEVSDTTYRKDSGVKLRKYAQAGIKDYWIENLNADRVEVYRDPRNPTGKLADCHYDSITRFHRGDAIPVAARPGISIAVDDLLP
jgi:Uma2 family endonuclease